MATPHQKRDAPIFVGRWKKLDTAGDVKRFLRQIILQAYADKMPAKKAHILGQLGLFMLKAIEVADLEGQLLQLEEHRARVDETRSTH